MSEEIEVRTFRGNYLCTQCLGERQPKDGPDADLLFEIGPKDEEEYACRPCAERITAGHPLMKLVIAPHIT